jgi:hypothetical protein
MNRRTRFIPRATLPEGCRDVKRITQIGLLARDSY